jgi:hypothetical protein
MPGMFCDAMVTMKSGSAMLISAGSEKRGVINTGCGQSGPICDSETGLVTAMRASAARTAEGTA